MPERAYPLKPGGVNRIYITWKRGYKDVTVLVDKHQLGVIPNRKALKEGQTFFLPDKSPLYVRLRQPLGIDEL